MGGRAGRAPKLWHTLHDYTLDTFGSDAAAGITVGLVALPLVLAFAIASGVPPEWGIYCAVVTSAIVSVSGGSRTQIAGPSGAFLVLGSGIVAEHGAPGLFLGTLMAGILLLLLGITGLGSATRFLPQPVTVGLMNGISILVVSTQVRDFFGLTMSRMPGELLPRGVELARSFQTLSWPATIVGVASLALLIVCQHRGTRIPGTIVALFTCTLITAIFGVPVDTIDSRFQGLSAGLPELSVSQLDPMVVGSLLSPAFTVAVLGAFLSLRAADAADRLSADRHNSSAELVAQGLANMAAPLVGGLPAAGALERSLVNVRAGARTPIAGIVHALTLALALLLAAPLVASISMPLLAAIVVMTAWNIGHWHDVPALIRSSHTDTGVWLVTLLVTALGDLTTAVPVAMALAALLFIFRAASTTDVATVADEMSARARLGVAPGRRLPRYAAVFRVQGPFLFGSSDKLTAIADRIDALPPIVILRLRYMTALDMTGMQAIEDLARSVLRTNRVFLVSEARGQPLELMRKARFPERLGWYDFCATFHVALERAEEIFEQRFSSAWPHLAR
jgi:SulP family sulfate permease